MSDNDKSRESRSASRSVTPRGSGKLGSQSPAQSPAHSKGGSHSKSRSRSRSKSWSHSHRSRRHYSRSRSRSYHHRSHSRSYSGERRRRSHSHSPMSNRRRHIGNRANPDPNCCLGVFGLSLYTTERDLRDVFSKYGPLDDVSIVYDQQSRRSRGFAFVYFENTDDAKEAKERANGMELDGRTIRVDFSITKRPHTPTPGIYMAVPLFSSCRIWVCCSLFYPPLTLTKMINGLCSSRRRSPSPYYRGAYRSRSRSRSYSPRKSFQ
uniref:Transformer-2 protein homolog beta n=1 Tax=Neolamprologus brichardi TaxID=32507 RepID=A0A3Q4HG77_NEOBR